ncbi:uncharacterized protein LOC135825552 [Sycon ciliatum]|uniref:uncharacterized protein LOC135825552 n=1 Tax=Sycon ciliatum TaxID=27933 RepID=UPI0031F68A62
MAPIRKKIKNLKLGDHIYVKKRLCRRSFCHHGIVSCIGKDLKTFKDFKVIGFGRKGRKRLVIKNIFRKSKSVEMEKEDFKPEACPRTPRQIPDGSQRICNVASSTVDTGHTRNDSTTGKCCTDIPHPGSTDIPPPGSTDIPPPDSTDTPPPDSTAEAASEKTASPVAMTTPTRPATGKMSRIFRGLLMSSGKKLTNTLFPATQKEDDISKFVLKTKNHTDEVYVYAYGESSEEVHYLQGSSPHDSHNNERAADIAKLFLPDESVDEKQRCKRSFGDYDLESWNCECFATFCKTTQHPVEEIAARVKQLKRRQCVGKRFLHANSTIVSHQVHRYWEKGEMWRETFDEPTGDTSDEEEPSGDTSDEDQPDGDTSDEEENTDKVTGRGQRDTRERQTAQEVAQEECQSNNSVRCVSTVETSL